MLIYCVEDDESIRDLVGYALRGQGYGMEGFGCADDFYKGMKKAVPDLVLLDVMLPGEDGLSILKKIREREANIPIIMMTAKSSEFDVVRGLDLGADDYVTKPFGIMELLSRIRSVLRRSGKMAEKKGELTVTLKEFQLLCYLLLNKGIVLSREQIMQAVWDIPFEMESRTIDMHIMSLRQKLGGEGAAIRTIRGVGYRLGEREK